MICGLRAGWKYAKDYSEFIRGFSNEELLGILDNPARKKKLYEFMDRFLERGFLFGIGEEAYWISHPVERAEVYYEAGEILKRAFEIRNRNPERMLEEERQETERLKTALGELGREKV